MRYENGIGRWTLRFKNPGLEKGFMLSRKQRLSEWTSMMIILLCGSGIFFSVLLASSPPDQYPTDAAVSVSKWQAAVWLGGGAVVVVMLVVGKVLDCSRMSPRNVMLYMEFATTAGCCVGMLMTIGSSRHYLARISGYDDPEAVWGRGLGYVDGLNLLFINVCASFGHLSPVRWVLLFPLEVALVLVFELPIFVWGSPAPEVVPLLSGCAVVLAVLAAVGKRHSDLQDRLLFKRLLSEKKLRFEAEHELSMQKESTDATKRRGSLTQISAIDSRPETTPSALAFESSFAEIRAIGVREQWLIEGSEVKAHPDRVLGKGGFGVVFEGLCHSTPVALKAPRQDMPAHLSIESLSALCNELRILRRLRHPNIVFLYGAIMDESFVQLCLVLEHVDGVVLRHFIQVPEVAGSDGGGAGAAVDDRVQIVRDIVSALRYMHSRTPAVVHGDLKDSNIFVQQLRLRGGTSARAKLLDFGLSRLLTRQAKPLGGTTRWMAPELFEDRRIRPDTAADVYSFGLLMFFISTGAKPFEDVDDQAIAQRRDGRLPLFLSWPDGSSDLETLQSWCAASVERCTQTRPEQRPTVGAVCDELDRLLDAFGWAGAGDAGWARAVSNNAIPPSSSHRRRCGDVGLSSLGAEQRSDGDPVSYQPQCPSFSEPRPASAPHP